ncbi:MAG: hypothetical protein JWQ79_418 [Mucilaginibacter sp.]|nr:hypothetical protein [Mucilaginibacter sp.]
MGVLRVKYFVWFRCAGWHIFQGMASHNLFYASGQHFRFIKLKKVVEILIHKFYD